MQNKLRNKLRGGIYLVSACSYLHSEPSHLSMFAAYSTSSDSLRQSWLSPKKSEVAVASING